MAQLMKDLDGKPILRGGQEVFTQLSSNIIKSVDPKTRTLIMRGTNEQVDRDGDIVRMSGIVLDNFLKNPVFLWAHDYKSVPLGAAFKVIKRRIPDPHMEFHIRFPSEGLNPFADMILGLYHEGIVNASSIGFIPLEHKPRQLSEGEDANRYWNPKEFLKSELLELSGCAVPCNPGAVQNALQGKTFGGLDLKGIVNVLEKGLPMPEIDRKDDILGELHVKSVLLEEEDGPTMVQVGMDLEDSSENKSHGEVDEDGKTQEEKVDETVDFTLKNVIERVIGLEEKLDTLTGLVRSLVETKGAKGQEEKAEENPYESLLTVDSDQKTPDVPASQAEEMPQSDLEKLLAPMAGVLAEMTKQLQALRKKEG